MYCTIKKRETKVKLQRTWLPPPRVRFALGLYRVRYMRPHVFVQLLECFSHVFAMFVLC